MNNSRTRSRHIVAGSVALVTFLVYLPALWNGFVNWDDGYYVYKNDFIRSFDAQFLKAAFLEFHAGYWIPVTWLSHALDYALWGLMPLGHHLSNNIFHALNSFLVVLLVIHLMEAHESALGQERQRDPLAVDRDALITAAVAGLLFGIHPLHVESTAWVAERKDLLCALFFLLSVMAYTRSVFKATAAGGTGSSVPYFNRGHLPALVLFALSLASKPMAVSLPLVLILLDWYPFRRIRSLRTFWTSALEKLPFFLLALAASVLAIASQQSVKTVASLEAYPLSTRLLVAAKAPVAYLGKMLLPVELVPFYAYPAQASFFSLEYGVPIMLAAGITAACVVTVGKNRIVMAGWVYYLLTLFPVLGLVQVGNHAMADRFTYLPSLAPFLLAGLLAAKAYAGASVQDRRRKMAQAACSLGAVAVIGSLSYATVRQIGVWKNDIVFWNYIIEREPSRFQYAHKYLGEAYLSGGRTDAAIEQLLTAAKLIPCDADIHYQLGIAYYDQGRLEDSADHYRTALKLDPGYLEAYNNLGNIYLSQGRLDQAREQFLSTLRLKPDSAEAHFNLGLVYLKQGAKDKARNEFQIGLASNPDNARAQQILRDIDSRP